MKKFLAILCALVLCLSVFSAVAETVKASQPWKIALITMDSIDQHWVKLNEGAQAKAAELGVTVDFMSPNTKDGAQQIEAVNNAVAKGYNAILVAANGPDAISGALKEAQAAGIKVIYVDSPANVPAEATFSTDNQAAGKTVMPGLIESHVHIFMGAAELDNLDLAPVHGIDNLHVAGSSVFPTGGWAFPTFTIAALSLRLADRLAESAKPDPAPGPPSGGVPAPRDDGQDRPWV